MAKATEKTAEQNMFEHLVGMESDMRGYEDINMSTSAIPFIRIIQALSPQLNKRKPEYIAGAEVGQVCNSITGKIYPTPLKVVIGKFEQLFIEWKANRGGFVQAHSPDTIENNPLYTINDKYQLVDPKTQNIFVDTYMYYILFPDYPEDGICIMSMSSTQLKEARKLNRILRSTYIPGTTQKADPHFMVWDFDVLEMSNDKGDWFTPSFRFDTFVTKAQLTHVTEERALLPDKKVDYAQLDETAGKVDDAQPVGDVKY